MSERKEKRENRAADQLFQSGKNLCQSWRRTSKGDIQATKEERGKEIGLARNHVIAHEA